VIQTGQLIVEIARRDLTSWTQFECPGQHNLFRSITLSGSQSVNSTGDRRSLASAVLGLSAAGAAGRFVKIDGSREIDNLG
jgi:hypothetical protein